jgi:hypothetical protein
MRSEEFRGVRLTLVALSMVSWPAVLVWDACSGHHCAPIRPDGEELAFVALLVGALHLALLISFTLERGGWVARLAGAVIQLPTLGIAAAGTTRIILNWPREAGLLALCLPFLVLHVMQLWRLSGIPFPRIQPLALEHVNFVSPQVAPGSGPAQRNAGR